MNVTCHLIDIRRNDYVTDQSEPSHCTRVLQYLPFHNHILNFLLEIWFKYSNVMPLSFMHELGFWFGRKIMTVLESCNGCINSYHHDQTTYYKLSLLTCIKPLTHPRARVPISCGTQYVCNIHEGFMTIQNTLNI